MSADGAPLVKDFCVKFLQKEDRAFHNPAKIRRWGNGVSCPNCRKLPYSENVLVRRGVPTEGRWLLCEIDPQQGGQVTTYPLGHNELRCITYTALQLLPGAKAEEVAKAYGDADPSEPCWVDGSTLIRRGTQGHTISAVPRRFSKDRFVQLSLFDAFLRTISSRATFAVTGATLSQGSPFATPLSKEVSLMLGELLGKEAASRGSGNDAKGLPLVLATGSMRGHPEVMSADHDFAEGFRRIAGCTVVHFKGSNSMRLHGDVWNMPDDSGTSYVLEEETKDYSNHAKEAAIMVCASAPRSIALCSNGGPTVGTNVVRFLNLCLPHRVFSICGLHSGGGRSGAAASFALTEEAMQGALRSLLELKGTAAVFAEKQLDPSKAAALLTQKPLTLLEAEPTKGCVARLFHLAPGKPNETPSPGIAVTEGDAKTAVVEKYSKACIQCLLQVVDERNA